MPLKSFAYVQHTLPEADQDAPRKRVQVSPRISAAKEQSAHHEQPQRGCAAGSAGDDEGRERLVPEELRILKPAALSSKSCASISSKSGLRATIRPILARGKVARNRMSVAPARAAASPSCQSRLRGERSVRHAVRDATRSGVARRD